LSGQEKIWENEDRRFNSLHHVLYFGTIKNPVADSLRLFKSRSQPNIQQLFVTNKFGTLVAMTDRTDTNIFSHSESEWWPIVSGEVSGKNDIYVGYPISLPDGSTGIPIAVPILNQNNSFVGTVHGIIPVQELLIDVLASVELDEQDIDLAIVFQNQILPLNSTLSFPQTSPFSTVEVNDFLSETGGEGMYGGETSAIVAADINFSSNSQAINNPWTILAAQPQTTIEDTILRQQQFQTIIGFAIVGFATVLALAMAQLVASPILRLADVAQKLKEGELSARADVESTDEIGTLAASFNAMADQSQQLVSRLETRVAERTRFLEASFRVSQTLSSITEKDKLLQEVVDQLQSSFNYYHVHVYLVDEATQQLKLVAGSGQVGHQLIELNHSLSMGTGLVGQAAVNNLSVLIPNVESEEKWVPNRLLPETKSEMSIPISIGTKVLGVIDVQENEVDRLQPEDADLVQSIARQVAVALRNAEQLDKIRRKADQESVINTIREKINSTNNIEDALKVAVKELGRALNSQDTIISLQPDQYSHVPYLQPYDQSTAILDNGHSEVRQESNGKVYRKNGTG
ncbi:MAG: GAF domain-containing protein, partial [Chloroflexota bacterium]